jgi:hypothetical protein
MIAPQTLFRLTLAFLLVASSACSPSAGNSSPSIAASTDSTSDAQIAQLKEKLWEAIRAKNAQKFLDCFFIEERFNTPTVRETNLKQIEYLLGRETIDIEIEEIPAKDLADIIKIQNARPDTAPRYSLLPKKMLRLHLKIVNGSSGRRFLIGEKSGQWYIVTLAGHTT